MNKLLLLPALLFLSCGGNTDEQTNTTPDPQPEAKPEVTKVKYYTDQNLPELDFSIDGDVQYAATWEDANGSNTVLLTLEEPIEEYSEEWQMLAVYQTLHGYHFTEKDGETNTLWHIKDFVEECTFDLILSHMENTLEVFDLDDDGIAETVFMYKYDCVSDVSPLGLKLMMHEGPDKYAIRGTTRVYPGGPDEQPIGGEGKPDPAFESAPEHFLTVAQEKWNDFVEL